MSNNPKHKNVEIKCFARTRRGTLCQTPRVTGRKRCRMHGGTSNGAPKGNKNAFKHGKYSGAVIANRKDTVRLIKDYKELIKELETLEYI